MFGTQTWIESNWISKDSRLTHLVERALIMYDGMNTPSNSSELTSFYYEQFTDRANAIHKLNPSLRKLLDVIEAQVPEKGQRRMFVNAIIFGV